jgi:peptidoglycan/LPS O-acetylase OafA/YrhL
MYGIIHMYSIPASRYLQFPKFGTAKATGPSVRVQDIDGIRGWAALVVVCFHIFWEIFGLVIPYVRNPWTMFFLDGRLAVSVFFILSGSALSSAYFAGKGRRAVIQLVVKRYPRLTIPILATSLILFGLYACGLLVNAEAGDIVHRDDWLGSFLRFPISLTDVLTYAFGGVYVPFSLDHLYPHPGPPGLYGRLLPFLWTMPIELIGSFMVFALLLSLHGTRFGWPILVTAAAALLATSSIGLIAPSFQEYACFLFGVIYSGMRAAGLFQRAHASAVIQRLTWAAIVAVIAFDAARGNGFFAWQFNAHIAIVFTLAVFCNRRCSDFFANSLSRRLGELSFPIYLLQFPIMVSLTSFCIIYASNHSSLTPAMALIIGIFTLMACFAAAVAFEPVEILTRRVGNMLVRCLPAATMPQRRASKSDAEAKPGS